LEVERMITGIQILGILFGLFMIYLTYIYQKRRELSAKEGLFWSALWVAFVLISVVPSALNFLVKDVLSMSRPLDFLIIVGFMFLIGVTFYNYRSLKRSERRLEEIVRKIAITKAGEKR
jgi:hypothetical protein